jgi:hypothetical protein
MAAAPSPLAAGMKAAIERACGPRIRDVRVEVQQGSNAVVVQFVAQNTDEATRYWDRIKTLPELQSYRVDVKVYLAQ